MNIAFYVNKVNWSPKDSFLGGSEEYIKETAQILAKKNSVTVYYDQENFTYNGVHYKNRYTFENKEIDVLISFKTVAPFLCGKKNIYVTNDIYDRVEVLPYFDSIVGISNFHLDQFLGRNSKTHVIPLACWVDQFTCNNEDKEPKSCLYSSSPDRGLHFLLSIWEHVYNQTGAKLYVTYGGNGKEIPGVTFLGKISETEMEKVYKKCMYWLHPCQGIELFCISGYKAQCAGCTPIYNPVMCLPETIKFGFQVKLPFFKEALIEIINKGLTVKKETEFLDWNDVTDQLIKLF